MPLRVRCAVRPSQPLGYLRPKTVDPATNCFVGNFNASFSEQFFDVPQAEVETGIKPDRLLNDRRREMEIAVADLGHLPMLAD